MGHVPPFRAQPRQVGFNTSVLLAPGRAQSLQDEVALVLADSLDFEETLAHVASLFVPEFADWAAVDVVAPDGSLRQFTSSHTDPDKEAFLLELRLRYRAETGGDRGALAVIASGRPELVEDVDATPHLEIGEEDRERYAALAAQSYMIVPLEARGRIVGALTLLSLTPGRRYGAEDLELGLRLAERCAYAVHNARLFREAEETIGLLDALFSTAPVGLALLDLDLRFVRVNDHLAALAGRPAGELVGRRPADLMPAGGLREELMREVLDSGRPLLEREVRGGEETQRWLVSCTVVPGRDGGPVGLLETVVDESERQALLARERAERERAALLARTGELLDASLDPETTLRNVAAVIVPGFADWCAIHLQDAEGGLRTVAVAHADPEREAWAWRLQERYPPDPDGATGAPAVVRTGEPEVRLEVPDALLEAAAQDAEHLEILRRLRITGVITAPLRGRGRTLGAISFAAAGESGRRFTQDDVAVALEIARRAALAVDNARLYTARAEIAHTLQSRLLPARLPEVPGVELAARYRASGEFNEVGGDFYDAMGSAAGDWVVCVGDVTGKGAAAAAVTALARYTLRAAALRPGPPSALLATLNQAMLGQDETAEHCTACVARLRVEEGRVRGLLCLAGHEPALVLRASGEVEVLGAYGSLLGLLPDPDLEDVPVELGPRDVLLLHTDGVTDAGMPHRPLGQDGLAALLAGLRGCAPDRLLAAVERAAVQRQDGEPRDDIALVALRPALQAGNGRSADG